MTTTPVDLETAVSNVEPKGEGIQRQFDIFGANQLLRQVLNAMPSMVAVLNQDRRLIFLNEALYVRLNEPQIHEVLGRKPGDVVMCPHAPRSPKGCGHSRHCLVCGLAQAFEQAKGEQEPVSRECVIQQEKNHEALEFMVRVTPLRLQDDHLYLVALQDIAHQKTVSLLERTFFHDILNAAGGVKGLAHLLDDASDMDEVDDYAPLMVQQADQLVEAIHAQRDILAAERGKLTVESQPVGSLTIIQSLLDLYHSHPVSDGRILKRADDCPRFVLNTGRVLLLRTLGNMIKNALEASRRGQTITLGCEDLGGAPLGQVRFWVHNEMVIPEDVQEFIFNRSFSTKGEGRGVGTYSMKLLGEKYLHGKVGFTSRPGKGTTFWIELPRQA